MINALARTGVATRLMTGLGILALFTAIGGSVAVISFNQFHKSFDQLVQYWIGLP